MSLKLPFSPSDLNISHFQLAMLRHFWILDGHFISLSNLKFVLLAFKVLYIHLKGIEVPDKVQGKEFSHFLIVVDTT